MPASKTAKNSNTVDVLVVGRWIFLVGLVLSVVYGLASGAVTDTNVQQWAGYILMALGFVGGLLYIMEGSEQKFIILTVGLALFYNSFGNLPIVGDYLGGMFGTLLYFLGFAVVAVVVRNIVSWFAS